MVIKAQFLHIGVLRPNGAYLSKKGRHCERSAAISCYGISHLEIATSLRSSQ